MPSKINPAFPLSAAGPLPATLELLDRAEAAPVGSEFASACVAECLDRMGRIYAVLQTVSPGISVSFVCPGSEVAHYTIREADHAGR